MADKSAPWFRHDSTASMDPKIVPLLSRYGMAGYGRWWRLVEALRNEADYRLPVGERTTHYLALIWLCEPDEARAFLDALVSDGLELVATDGAWYWSDSLNRRMAQWQEICDHQRNAGRASAVSRRSRFGTAQPPGKSPNTRTTPNRFEPIPNGVRKTPNRTPEPVRVSPNNELIERENLVSLSLSESPPDHPVDGAGGAPSGASAPTPEERQAELERQAKAGNPFAAMKTRELHRQQPAPDLEDGIPW